MQLRRDNTEMIEQHLKKAGLALWPKPDEADVTMLRYPVPTQEKSRIICQARKQKLDVLGWYESPVHPLKGDDLAKVNYLKGSCEKAENMIKQLLYLPTGPTMNRQNLEKMIELICKT